MSNKECIISTISAMLHQEEHYKSSSVRSPSATYLRRSVYRRMLQVVETSHLADRETAFLAISYLDRYMNTSTSRAIKAVQDPVEYRLLAFVSLYIAVKVNEPAVFSASGISKLTKGRHTAGDIEACESSMLEGLNWLLFCPTPHQYIQYLLALLPRDDALGSTIASTLYADCQHEIELIMETPRSVSTSPSQVAIEALFRCLDRSETNLLPSNERMAFRRSVTEVMDTVASVHSSQSSVCRSLFRSHVS